MFSFKSIKSYFLQYCRLAITIINFVIFFTDNFINYHSFYKKLNTRFKIYIIYMHKIICLGCNKIYFLPKSNIIKQISILISYILNNFWKIYKFL